MKKTYVKGSLCRRLAVTLGVPALIIGMASCSSKAAEKSDSDSMVIEEELSAPVQTAQLDSTAAIFADPAKKSEVATDSTYAVTASGLKYMILREGTGKSPKATDVVTVHYSGNLPDGTVFDSSYDRGEPTSFPLNRVIPGWTEGLQLMKTGGKAVFYIPSNLAYGPTGTPGGPIGPNQDLLFTVELIEVN